MAHINIVHIISSLEQGGAQKVLDLLMRNLPQDMYKHHVIFFHDGPYKKHFNSMGITTYSISGFITRYDPVFSLRLFLLIKKLKPDILCGALWAANIYARCIGYALNIPVISTLHALPEHEGAFKNWLTRMAPHATRYCAVSPSIKKSFEYNCPTAHIITIPNGIACMRSALCRKKNKKIFTIGSVGRFVPVKNYHLLIASFKEIYTTCHHTRLILIGHGPLEQNLKNYAQELDIGHAVTFIINKPADAYYNKFDCFVQSSDYEGISMALLEAMSHKLPVIVTGVTSTGINNHDVIENYHDGIIIPSRNQEALTHAIKEFMYNPDLRSTCARNGYNKVITTYTTTTMCTSYHRIFTELIYP
ncbi:MAG: glycosyltransferase [Candidatus Babeliaceae bacterium]|jgi:glycosyltransferase involved in cell wall biosynthesis